MSRLRSRCITVAVSVAFAWLFFAFHFLLFERVPESEDVGHGELPVLVWPKREAVKGSRNTLSESQEFSLRTKGRSQNADDDCRGRYLYVYELPEMFNERLVENCRSLTMWTNMCNEIINEGFGPPLKDPEGIFQGSAWHATNQFNLELIYHSRIRRHKCLTDDSSKANAFFVPFYSGLEVMPHLWDGANITERDYVPQSLETWLLARPEWKRLHGHDHFMTAGRITWDFRRRTDEENDWGNKLLLLPGIMNLTTLLIEASPWHSNDYAVPYPSYFHPSTDEQIISWQSFVRGVKRSSLFCFAGAPRPEIDASIRSQLMLHCRDSPYCNLLACGKSSGKCFSPSNVMKLFKESVFCLQPQGDSFTRRSIFDSMLAGCIPVFFHVYTAYAQYGWHFPEDRASYSVFIDEELVRAGNISVEETLRSIPSEKIEKMRDTVISLIPRIVYAKPESKLGVKDAFDVTLDGIHARIDDYRRSIGVSKSGLRGELHKEKVLTAEDVFRRDQAEKEAARMALDLSERQTKRLFSADPDFLDRGINYHESWDVLDGLTDSSALAMMMDASLQGYLVTVYTGLVTIMRPAAPLPPPPPERWDLPDFRLGSWPPTATWSMPPLVKPSSEEPPPTEERALPFVEKPDRKAVARINRELRQRIYLMGKRILGHERNPTGVEFYVMGEIGKTFTVKIREFPACQCGDFLLSRLCKHTAFVWSRVLKLNQNDPVIWQKALLPSEGKRVILNHAITPPKPKSKFKRLRESFSMGYGPHDILEHEPVYCPVSYEEVNFFADEVYQREESLLEELYTQNLEKKGTQLKAKLDMGTPRSIPENKKKDAAAPPPQAAAPPPPPPPPPAAAAAAAPPADSQPNAEGQPVPAEGVNVNVADAAAAAPPAPATGQTEAAPDASPPSPAAGDDAAAATPVTASDGGEEAKPIEGTKVEEGLKDPRNLLGSFEPLLFCPQKSCEFEGCVKVVHRYCWLRWGRFRKVDWTLPNIIQVNKCFPLASTCL
ncbi:hypothetical protein R1sor_023217 [Riccia sorocarpa]|uniref:SWIM-type domain-containing protein n=1 Tax=Riccia sorocarpa TaxID=122646 RepID=A0ABD3GR00_9MARC